MIPTLNVLITGAGTVTCQSVVKGLRRQAEIQVHITTVDPNPLSAGRYMGDSFYVVPVASDENFLTALLEVVKRESVQLLIPIVDYEFPKFAQEKAKFEALGCMVAISSPDAIALCNCKDQTYRFLRQIGIRTPMTWLPSELPEPSHIRFPLFIKPRTGRASIDVHKICCTEELTFWKARVDDPIFQEFAEGDEYTIDVLSDFEGRVIGAVARRRIEMKVGISYKGVTVRDPQMLTAAKSIAERAGIIGPCNIQCFREKHGLNFFEINPRFSGSLPLTIAAGLNSPHLLAKMALGHRIEQTHDSEEGLVMLRFWEEIFVSESGSAQHCGTILGGESQCDGD